MLESHHGSRPPFKMTDKETNPNAVWAHYIEMDWSVQASCVADLRFRQWGEGARLAGGRSGETRGIGRWSGGVLRRVAAVSQGEGSLGGTAQSTDFWRSVVR